MAKLSVEQIRDLRTKFKQLAAKLLYKNIADFSKYAEEAESNWKTISIKILAYKKAVDAKMAKSTPAKIKRAADTLEKLRLALHAKDKKLVADIQKARAKKDAEAKKKAVKAKKDFYYVTRASK